MYPVARWGLCPQGAQCLCGGVCQTGSSCVRLCAPAGSWGLVSQLFGAVVVAVAHAAAAVCFADASGLFRNGGVGRVHNGCSSCPGLDLHVLMGGCCASCACGAESVVVSTVYHLFGPCHPERGASEVCERRALVPFWAGKPSYHMSHKYPTVLVTWVFIAVWH